MTVVERKKSFIHFFSVYGSISTGLIYATVGTIALLSFFKVRDGGADESSMLALINDYVVGKIFIWVILTGALCFVVWRFYEAFTDPYGYGAQTSGIVKRVGICLSAIADIMIAYTAIRVLLAKNHIMLNGQPREEQETVDSLLQESWGNEIIIALGVLVIVTAATQFVYGITRGYKERIQMDNFRQSFKSLCMSWHGQVILHAVLF